MAAHHKFTIPVACPDCGAPGALKVIEDAGPPFAEMPCRSYEADEPARFALVDGRERPQIECGACHAIFAPPI